jgi:hypothetical protein
MPARLRHHDSVTVRGEEVPVTQEATLSLPFGTLLHFRKAHTGGEPQPPVLLVAPLSGHFATLLRETARTLLQDHDVYITDWHNARDVPCATAPSAGRLHRAHDPASWRPSARARTWWRSASPAWRRWRPRPSWPRTTTRPSRAA